MGVWSKLGQSLGWPGAAPAQCPLASLSATSSLPLNNKWPSSSLSLWSRAAIEPVKRVSPRSLDVKRSELQRGLAAGETHREQIDTSRPSDSSSRRRRVLQQIKNLIQFFPTKFYCLDSSWMMNCNARLKFMIFIGKQKNRLGCWRKPFWLSVSMFIGRYSFSTLGWMSCSCSTAPNVL